MSDTTGPIPLSLSDAAEVLNKHRHQGHAEWRVRRVSRRGFAFGVTGPDYPEDLLSPLEAVAIAHAYRLGLTEETVAQAAEAQQGQVARRSGGYLIADESYGGNHVVLSSAPGEWTTLR